MNNKSIDWRVYKVDKEEKLNDITCFVQFESFSTREDARDFKRQRIFFEKPYRYQSPASNTQYKSVITRVEFGNSNFNMKVVR